MSLSFLVNIPEFLDDPSFVPPCAETDPNAFFPVDGEELRNLGIGSGRPVANYYYNESSAKAVCAECPLKTPCAMYAIENNEIGIWGGTTENDRRKIRMRFRYKKSIDL